MREIRENYGFLYRKIQVRLEKELSCLTSSSSSMHLPSWAKKRMNKYSSDSSTEEEGLIERLVRRFCSSQFYTFLIFPP